MDQGRVRVGLRRPTPTRLKSCQNALPMSDLAFFAS